MSEGNYSNQACDHGLRPESFRYQPSAVRFTSSLTTSLGNRELAAGLSTPPANSRRSNVVYCGFRFLFVPSSANNR